jgi:glycosyltransferase involved in cell wall biosynthesis
MKIAILGTHGIPARYGGFESFAEKLAIDLSMYGYEVTVFCESSNTTSPITFHNVSLRYVSAPAHGPIHTIIYDIISLWKARNKYDVVYMLGYGTALFCIIPRLWGAEVWINLDGHEWARSKWGLVAKCYLRLMEWISLYSANYIIADAEAIKISLIKRHMKASSCIVMPYGSKVIDISPATDLLLSYNILPMEYYLIVCRLEPENHVLEILQAFHNSQSKRQLIVVGDYLSKTRYVAQLNTVNDNRIRMIGTVYDQDKLTCLRYYSYVYFHGHSVGGTNPSLLEAMGCGNLIYAHDNIFNRETLGNCGLYFANERELTQIIDTVEKDESSYVQYREASKLRAATNYSWSDVISRYEAMLLRVSARGV